MHNRKEMARGTIYVMAGIYICITAYQMYKNLDASMGGERFLVTIFILLFALLGAGLATAGGYMIYKGNKGLSGGSERSDSEDQKQKEDQKQQENQGDYKSM